MTAAIAPLRRVMPLQVLWVLMAVQWVLVLPFLRYLPLWLGLVLVLVMLWRWQVMHGELRPAPLWLTLTAIAVGVAGLIVSGLNRYTLDSAVSLCVLGYLLKSLEVLRRRDGVFQVYLGYFLVGVYLLYHYNPLGALISLLMVLANTLALFAIFADRTFQWTRGLKQSGGLMAAAIPIMLVGFLFFPRIPPLWSIPNDERGARTGMTDEVTPGSVSALAMDRSPAFRVAFDGDLPPRGQWYWRGTTLDQFNGTSWRASYRQENRSQWPRGRLPEPGQGPHYDYSVVMQASQQHWLYFLDWPVRIDADDGRVLPDGRAATRNTLTQAMRYQARSQPAVLWPDEPGGQMLALPDGTNQRLADWAQQARREAGSDRAFMDGLMQHIRTQPFFYTLRPPLYPGNQGLAEFWFEGRRGFCTHYASAMAFMARAVGIPARLVGGYLGGLYNDNGGFIQVRQMEAHVWVEVWLDGRWERYDPTAAVAPGRVESNLDEWQEAANLNELPFATRFASGLPLYQSLSLWWGSVEYQWQNWVLNYQQDNALSTLEQRFGQINWWHAGAAMGVFLGILGLLMAIATGVLRWPTRLQEPWASLRRLEKRFGARDAGETVSGYLERLAGEQPQQRELLRQITVMINEAAYNPEQGFDKHKRRYLQRLIRDAI
ncbi:MAG: transglutaminase family protein [Saccharospirillum sp.]